MAEAELVFADCRSFRPGRFHAFSLADRGEQHDRGRWGVAELDEDSGEGLTCVCVVARPSTNLPPGRLQGWARRGRAGGVSRVLDAARKPSSFLRRRWLFCVFCGWARWSGAQAPRRLCESARPRPGQPRCRADHGRPGRKSRSRAGLNRLTGPRRVADAGTESPPISDDPSMRFGFRGGALWRAVAATIVRWAPGRDQQQLERRPRRCSPGGMGPDGPGPQAREAP